MFTFRTGLVAGLMAIGSAALADPTPPATTTTTTTVTTTADAPSPPTPPPPLLPEPPPTLNEPGLTILPKPVPSPLHPRHRMVPGFFMGAGVYCPNVGSHSVTYGAFCAAQLRLAIDNKYGDVHGSLLLGDALRVGIIGGFDLGSPYWQLGPRRSRLAMAIRGSFDGVISSLGRHVPGHYSDGYAAFSNTWGPNLSIAINPHTSFEMRGAVGWTVAGFFSDHDGFDGKSVYGFVAEGWLGMRFSP